MCSLVHTRTLLVNSVWLTICCSSSPQLQAYALVEMSKGEHTGYSHQACATSMGPFIFKDISSDVRVYCTISIIGFVFVVIFYVMGSFVLLQVILRTLSQKMETCNYSFDSYGMFWGMSVILCPSLMVLLYEDITHVCQAPFDVVHSEYFKYMWPFIFAIL